MAEYMYQLCLEKRWITAEDELVDAVAIRVGKHNYVVHPKDQRDAAFGRALNSLNCEIAVTFSADVVKVVAATIHPDADSFVLDSTTSIQVVDDMSECVTPRSLVEQLL